MKQRTFDLLSICSVSARNIGGSSSRERTVYIQSMRVCLYHHSAGLMVGSMSPQLLSPSPSPSPFSELLDFKCLWYGQEDNSQRYRALQLRKVRITSQGQELNNWKAGVKTGVRLGFRIIHRVVCLTIGELLPVPRRSLGPFGDVRRTWEQGTSYRSLVWMVATGYMKGRRSRRPR